MNASLRKLSFVVAGLAMAGAAHAATVPVTGSVDLDNPSSTPSFFANGNYDSGGSSTDYYQLVLPTAGSGASMDISYAGTLPNDATHPNQPVVYSVWTATGVGSTATLGTEVGTMTLSPSSTSWLLSLAAGAEYVLEVVLNSSSQSTSAIISGAVSAVPLPGTALLFGTALLGGIGLMRRRSQKGGAVPA